MKAAGSILPASISRRRLGSGDQLALLDEGIMAGRVTRVQGRDFQLRLDSIRREFLQRIKERPFAPEERTEISSRLDSLERDINRVW